MISIDSISISGGLTTVAPTSSSSGISPNGSGSGGGGSGAALATVDEFSPAAVSTLLSEEIREAVVSTAYLAIGQWGRITNCEIKPTLGGDSGTQYRPHYWYRLMSVLSNKRSGGPAGGLLFASVTGGTLEDLLLMTIGGLAAYVSVINLPLR